MPDDPAPDDAPTPPAGVPLPYAAPEPPRVADVSGAPAGWGQQGGYGAPQMPQGSPWPGSGRGPGYLDTPAPVVNKADTDKPPADFDG